MFEKLKSIMLKDTPKYRSEEARECGSVPRLRVPRMRERKARKVMNAGNAERGGRMSRIFVNLKDVMLNDTPKYRSAGGCPVCYAGRMGWAVRLVQNDLIVVPSVSDRARKLFRRARALCSTTLQSIGVFMENERRYAQRYSKVSE